MASETRSGADRIVVGVDGSSAAFDALKWAYRQAVRTGDELHLITTYELDSSHNPYSPSYAYAPDSRTAGHLSEAESKWREERQTIAQERAERMVQDVLRAVRAVVEGDPKVTHEVIGQGRPAEVLVDRSHHASLLVVGSRGLGGFRGLLLGSGSQQCVHHAGCPVVVVRQGDR